MSSSSTLPATSLAPPVVSATAPQWLREIPTPAWVVDVAALERRVQAIYDPPPPLRTLPALFSLGDSNRCFRAVAPGPEASATALPKEPFVLGPYRFDPTLPTYLVPEMMNEREDSSETTTTLPAHHHHHHALFYGHATVLRTRDERVDPPDFLAQLDLPPTFQGHLVLGWNNHLTVSYYWARSAGYGASMRAPGVQLEAGTTLAWTGATSNDGKRSEWVHFLRPADQVQLVPDEPLETAWSRGGLTQKMWGVSSHGRPLGSEPVVVCRFVEVSNESQ